MSDRLEVWAVARRDPDRSRFFSQLERGLEVEVGRGVRVVPDMPDSAGCPRAHIKVSGVRPATIRSALGIWPDYVVTGIQAVEHALAVRNLIADAERALVLLTT